MDGDIFERREAIGSSVILTVESRWLLAIPEKTSGAAHMATF
jgi:hypothetical protein